MTRRHAAMTIVCASLAYMALSIADRAAASDVILLYIAVVVTLLLIAQVLRRAR